MRDPASQEAPVSRALSVFRRPAHEERPRISRRLATQKDSEVVNRIPSAYQSRPAANQSSADLDEPLPDDSAFSYIGKVRL